MKRIALVLLSLLMLASLAVPAMAADEGMTFTADKTHPINKHLDKAPVTFEAVVRIPKGYTERAGLIISSYIGGGHKDGITLQFNSGKQLELYYELAAGGNVRHKFTNIPVTSVATGEWVHITVVKDEAAGKAHAYINGEFVQTADAATKPYGYMDASTAADRKLLCIGGDHRNGNAYYWKGEIREIAMFSDIRTADEIKADAKAIKEGSDNMLVWYQLKKGDLAAKDLSGNGNHMGDYKEPETTKAQTTAATTKAPATKPTAPATFDAGVIIAAAAAVSMAGAVVLKKKR